MSQDSDSSGNQYTGVDHWVLSQGDRMGYARKSTGFDILSWKLCHVTALAPGGIDFANAAAC